MIKGCQKEMIVLQTRGSSLFESAYFVLRPGRSATAQGDMLAESNRIIEGGRDYLKKRRKKHSFFAFLGVFLAGSALGAGIVMIILL